MGTLHWPFIGHQHFGKLADRLLSEGRWPQASLFQGPANIGKSSIARWVVQRSLCEQSERPCGKCHTCQAIAEQRHPHAFVLDGEDSSISIEAIRQVHQRLATKSQHPRWVLLLQAEQMTEAAANSILKLIEDPPVNAYFICTSAKPHLIPATVRSRLAPFYFRPIATREVSNEDRALLLAVDGRIGLMERWRNEPAIRARAQTFAQEFCQRLEGQQLSIPADDQAERLEIGYAVLRQVLFHHLGLRRPSSWELSTLQLDRLAQRIPFDRLVNALQTFYQRDTFLLTNVSPRNVYEDLHQTL